MGRRRKQRQRQQRRADKSPVCSVSGRADTAGAANAAGANGRPITDWNSASAVDCMRETRRLVELVHREICQVLLDNFGLSDIEASYVPCTGSAADSKEPNAANKDAGAGDEDLGASGEDLGFSSDHADDSAAASETFMLRAMLAEREQELQIARARIAQLDAQLAQRAGAQAAGLWQQYELRERHFAAVERASALETQLWRQRHAQQAAGARRHSTELAVSRQIARGTAELLERSMRRARELAGCLAAPDDLACGEMEDMYRALGASAARALSPRDVEAMRAALHSIGQDLFAGCPAHFPAIPSADAHPRDAARVIRIPRLPLRRSADERTPKSPP
ncbi:hypothetical protein H4R23_005856 [Coemansia sp. Cherry 401B]|nr:hypothetical protein H4R23_005856 [Coemansia sp. Cherry 401B]